MRIAVDGLDVQGKTLWQDKGLSADWDLRKREIVVCGDASYQSFSSVVSSILEKKKLSINVEEKGSTKLKWQGRGHSAEFKSFENNGVECFLKICLDN